MVTEAQTECFEHPQDQPDKNLHELREAVSALREVLREFVSARHWHTPLDRINSD